MSVWGLCDLRLLLLCPAPCCWLTPLPYPTASSMDPAAMNPAICGFCTQTKVDPVLLACLHSVCARCAGEHAHPDTHKLECPVCEVTNLLVQPGVRDYVAQRLATVSRLTSGQSTPASFGACACQSLKGRPLLRNTSSARWMRCASVLCRRAAV